MDIEIVLTKVATLNNQALNYKALDVQKTAITGATFGVIEINDERKSVDGSEFVDVRDEWITSLTTSLASLKTSMDTLCDELITEIAS